MKKQGILTMALPLRSDLIPGTPSPPPENKEMIDNLSRALNSRIKFRTRIWNIWRKVVGLHSIMDLDQLADFVEKIEEELDVPAVQFGDLGCVIDIYDYNGDGSLQFKEAYKLVKHTCVQYRKQLGGHPEIDVEFKTPDEAGYRIVKVLGVGGQGTANLATDSHGNERVLKVYDKSNANGSSIQDLREEMEMMTTAGRHPAIALCHEIFQDSKNLYMVGDPYFGGDLASVQAKAKGHDVDLDEDWYRSVFYQSFCGLEYLHEHSILHCDIKEENIMMQTDDYQHPHVVIIDLGLAAATLQSTKVCGTPGYMPPETWDYHVWYPKGDVFSMGVVCIQMLTGNTPNAKLGKLGIFQRGGSLEWIVYNTKTTQPPFEDVDPCSEELMEWLPLALEKDFYQRLKPQEVLAHDWFRTVRRANCWFMC